MATDPKLVASNYLYALHTERLGKSPSKVEKKLSERDAKLVKVLNSCGREFTVAQKLVFAALSENLSSYDVEVACKNEVVQEEAPVPATPQCVFLTKTPENLAASQLVLVCGGSVLTLAIDFSRSSLRVTQITDMCSSWVVYDGHKLMEALLRHPPATLMAAAAVVQDLLSGEGKNA